MYVPDNYDMFCKHEAEREAEMDRLPRCSCCDEPIQEEYCYQFNGENICIHCLNEYYRKDTEDLME